MPRCALRWSESLPNNRGQIAGGGTLTLVGWLVAEPDWNELTSKCGASAVTRAAVFVKAVNATSLELERGPFIQIQVKIFMNTYETREQTLTKTLAAPALKPQPSTTRTPPLSASLACWEWPGSSLRPLVSRSHPCRLSQRTAHPSQAKAAEPHQHQSLPPQQTAPPAVPLESVVQSSVAAANAVAQAARAGEGPSCEIQMQY